jgi:hypothetical protein
MKTANKRNLVLVTPPEPPPELIQKALDLAFSNELIDFAISLEVARGLWRKYPELVEAPKFHPVLRAVFVDQTEHEPRDACYFCDEVLQPGYRETLLPEAIRGARVWMAQPGTEPS